MATIELERNNSSSHCFIVLHLPLPLLTLCLCTSAGCSGDATGSVSWPDPHAIPCTDSRGQGGRGLHHEGHGITETRRTVFELVAWRNQNSFFIHHCINLTYMLCPFISVHSLSHVTGRITLYCNAIYSHFPEVELHVYTRYSQYRRWISLPVSGYKKVCCT